MRDPFIIWDMDGTLLDSSYGITKTINEIRETKGLSTLLYDDVIPYINDNTINLAAYFYGTKEYLKEDKVLFEELYEQYCTQKLERYEGVVSLVKELYEQGVVMSVATNASTLFAKKMLTHCEMAHYFKAIVGANEVQEPKPSDQLLHHAAALSAKNLNTTFSFMVGDGIKDMLSAKKCGATAVHVTWGYSQLDEGFDVQCSSPFELEKVLKVNLFG